MEDDFEISFEENQYSFIGVVIGRVFPFSEDTRRHLCRTFFDELEDNDWAPDPTFEASMLEAANFVATEMEKKLSEMLE